MKKLIFFLTFVCICSFSFYLNDTKERISKSACFSKFANNKAYIKWDRLNISQKGSFLKRGEREISLNVIYFDDNGAYVNIDHEQFKLNWHTVTCVGCGGPRLEDEYCPNPNCPLSKEGHPKE